LEGVNNQLSTGFKGRHQKMTKQSPVSTSQPDLKQPQSVLHSFNKTLFYWLPSKPTVLRALADLAFVLIGSIILFPIVKKLPMIGWDWYYFFTAHNPTHNLLTPSSPYPPYTTQVLSLITWLDWRSSLALLHGATLLVLALVTWKQTRSFIPILPALFNPPVLMLLWIGHPDGIALLGVITGLPLLTFMKPQVAGWALLANRKLFLWSIIFIVLSFLIWGFWPDRMISFSRNITLYKDALLHYEATAGWSVMGWWLILPGLVLLAGAGRDFLYLMAAGCFFSPYLMPYHLALLVPLMGKARSWRLLLIWLASWLIFLGTGLIGWVKLTYYVFPLAAYMLTQPLKVYRKNCQFLIAQILKCLRYKRDNHKI
jgi:hypothetical protein